MTPRSALVVHNRMPAFDRDSGSQDVDNTIRFLLDAGWRVTFLSREQEGQAEQRHANRLRQMGIPTYAGFRWSDRLLRSGGFDLVVVAHWEPAEALLPKIREHAPRARVVINSMDVHLLREARRSFGKGEELGASFGAAAVRELNTYSAADAVIAVSVKEQELLADFLGEDRVHCVPLAEHVERSPVPLADRRGMLFVGNFRHLPNREAVEHLCGEVLPLLDPGLLERHPLTVLGNWLENVRLDVDPAVPGVELVGWVPSIEPYMRRSRLAVVPLLYGAGVKRKVIQPMMAGTPVVTTPVGAEGLDLVQGQHALIGRDAGDLASGIARLLTDDDLWQQLVEAGARHVEERHGLEVVRRCFDDTVERIMTLPRRVPGGAQAAAGAGHRAADAVRARLKALADPGAIVVVASGGDEALVELGTNPCWHFPQGREGGWDGVDPVDGRAAITHLEFMRSRGARYFVLPRTAFIWRHRYPELHDHLESTARRVHRDEHLVVYDLSPRASLPAPAVPFGARVWVLGTYAGDRAGPPPASLAELESSDHLEVTQRWVPAPEAASVQLPSADEADYVVLVRDDAVLPGRFLDDLIATHATLGVPRLQPTHIDGPQSGPPVTERQRGVVAREVDAVTPLPVLSMVAGAPLDGPVALADGVTIGLRGALIDDGAREDAALVRRVWAPDGRGGTTSWERREPSSPPRISVLITTYDRPELLRECLLSFAKQTIDRSEYEVVVVDDGSEASVLDELVEEFDDQLQITGLRIDHAGRSAAKNHCVLLARAPIVLFFDDDDRAAPDYLDAHLRDHDRHPGESVAILGHTDWAPELELSPLMHYVTDVDRLMFAYERLLDGQQLDWRGFWEGRISCKRALLVRHGLHDQRISYSIDIELGWRLSSHGLRVVYDESAQSVMARPIDLDTFCSRTQAKGRADAVIAALHPGTEVAERLRLEGAVALWEAKQHTVETVRRRVDALEQRAATDDAVLPELHTAYRELFRILHAKGVAVATEEEPAMSSERPTTVQPFPNTDPDLCYDASPAEASLKPLISISLPVWSRTPALAEMARETIERVWEVARLPTEVIVVDNGSPFEVRLPAKVYRYPENKGVATGWNTGIRLSTAPVVVVLNSDCRVEPGWDEALYEAATDGRRLAFPYTDHCDGRGFTQPDQGGTAGWCFMMAKSIYDEVGVFDEWFNPAFLEDTDYWHRAWELGIELSPVPAARVVHARRTTASTDPRVDMLLQGHRYKYGWKHGVDPHRAPPYYNRDIVEYVGRAGGGV
jgi:glycosyltransferase involved in cell wall biosynthesis